MGEIVAALGFEASTAGARAHELLDLGRGGLRREVLDFPGGAVGISRSTSEASIARSGNLIVALHGFVGNWEESGWGWSTEVRRGTNDAERVAVALRDRGEASIDRLRGEYALLAVDLALPRVVVARDTFGLRPLHRAPHVGGTLIATDIRPLRRLLNPRPNPEALRRLEREEAAEEETPFRGVFRFPAGVTALSNGWSGRPAPVGRRWELPEAWLGDEPGEEEEPPLADVVEDLDASLSRAVRRCLPSPGHPGGGRVGISLSGGVDSSVVWALAFAEAPAAHLPPPEALTLRFPGTATDEGPFVEAVLAVTGGERHESVLPCPLPASMLEEAAARTDTYHLPNLCLNLAVARLARAHGLDVVLSGYGGDQWFSGGSGVLGELVCRGRLVTAWRVGAALAERGYWTGGQLLAEALRAPLLRILKPPEPRDTGRRAWARAGGGYRKQLEETLRLERADPLSDQTDQLAATETVGFRNPLMDRDLVEVAVRIRDVRHIEGGRTKGLLRRVMEGRLPKRVLERDDKADFVPVLPPVDWGSSKV